MPSRSASTPPPTPATTRRRPREGASRCSRTHAWRRCAPPWWRCGAATALSSPASRTGIRAVGQGVSIRDMTDRDPWYPPPPSQPTPQAGQYIPPPPAYPVTSDIPPQSPYHYSSTPQQGNRGVMGWLASAALAAWAVVKYGLIVLVKIPAAGTLLSLLVSFGGYALFYGPWFAVALLAMLFVHEMGHVVEIRRQ